MVEDGVNGYVYHSGSGELAACIRKMLEQDGPAYVSMCRASMEKAKALFDPERYVEEIEAQYQKFTHNR